MSTEAIIKKTENEKLVGNHKRGRPTTTEQIEFGRVLWPYFENKISAYLTSKKTGINIKTVCEYFDKWKNEILESETMKNIEKYKEEKERTLMSLEGQKLELYDVLDDIKAQKKKLQTEQKPIPKHLATLQIQTIKSLSDLTIKINFVARQPINEIKATPPKIDIDEDEVRKIIVKILSSKNLKENQVLKRDELLQEIISILKCNLKYARAVCAKMETLGLNVCDKEFGKHAFEPEYDIASFAKIRDYN